MRSTAVRFGTLVLVLLGMVGSSFGHSNRGQVDADVIDLIAVSNVAVSKTETDFKYRVKVANRGRLLRNAAAYVSLDRRCNLRYTRITDNEVPLGTLAGGSVTVSSDTFTVRVNRAEKFSLGCLDFDINGEIANTPPVANAGPDRTVKVGDTVTLDGTASTDADGDKLRYIWKMVSKPTGSKAVLSSDCTGRPSFKVDLPGTYVFSLVVNDGKVNSAPAQVRISTANAAPIANAGLDRTVPRNSVVKLDGSASSDPNQDMLTYRWSIVSKPLDSAAVLIGATTVRPTITLDQPGSYKFKLIVNDGQLDSAPATVTISTENSVPVANAGPDQNARIGARVTLDGSGSSDADGDALSMVWTWQSLPDGSKAVLAQASTSSPYFTPDVAGLYVVQLIVNDGFADSAPDTVSVTIEVVANQPPRAVDDTATTTAGKAVDIDVLKNDSDPDPNTTLRVASFTQPARGGTVTAVGTQLRFTPSPGFTGTAVFTYTVSDGSLTATANVTVTVEASNTAPVVSAGTNQTLTLGASGTVSTTLNGSVTDDGNPAPSNLTIAWSQVSGPADAVFSTPAAAVTQAQFTKQGTYVLRLTASDGALTSAADVQVTVGAAPNSPPVLAPIANRSIAAGTALIVPLSATDPNQGDQLSFSLLASPSGAQLLTPAQVLWTPTDSQVGVHSFNVSVRDAAGASDTKSFQVTVTAANRPPVLAPLSDDTVVAGASYGKTLTATDPDGDTLTYELVSGPAGMTLSGNQLAWTVPASRSGPFTVSVRVSDSKGAGAAGIFKIEMIDSVAPIAADDAYTIKLGDTLTVAGPGVLANDSDAHGAALKAIRRSNPAKGSLTAFAADGGFTYSAPTADPRPQFAVTGRALTSSIYINDLYGEPLIGDINGDGYPDVVYDWFNQNHTAISGRDGSVLWQVDHAGTDGCFDWLTASSHHVLADIDDDGKLEYVYTSQCGANTRMVTVDQNGHTKWLGPVLTKPYTAVQCYYGNGYCPPEAQPVNYDMLSGVDLSVARLTPNSSPVILFRRTITADDGGVFTPQSDGSLGYKHYACALATGADADMERSCRLTFILSPTDGSIQQVLRAPPGRIDGSGRVVAGPYASEYQPPFTADLDGDGQVEIISGSDVWRLVNGQWTLAWQTPLEPAQVAVADLDGDGRAEVIHFHFREFAGPYNGEPLPGFDGFIIYNAEGVELRRVPLQPIQQFGTVTIADVDGDGTPEFLISGAGMLHAVSPEGEIKWTFIAPNSNSNPQTEPTVRLTSKTNVQVYDLDGDGVNEVVVSSLGFVHILDGRSGVSKVDFDAGQRLANSWAIRSTFVTDWNNDGHADVVSFAQGNGTLGGAAAFVLSAANNDWLPAGKSFHQSQFRMGDINDAGRILYNPSIDRSFRNPRQLGTIRDPRETSGTSFEYVANNGSADSNTAKVYLTIGPNNNPPVITSRPPTAIQASSTEEYLYQVTAVDPDAGDTIRYSLVSAPSWVRIDATTGAMRFTTGPCGSYGGACDYSRVTVIVAATDSQGAQTTQSFVVNVTTSSTTVPNVVGQTLGAAKQLALAAAMIPKVLQEQYSSQPVGTVIAQTPTASTTQPVEATLLLTVSKGARPVSLPSLVGQGLASANDQLVGLGLVVTVTPVFSTSVPAGQVLSQSVGFGSSLPPGTAVELTVSAGPPVTGDISKLLIDPTSTYRLTGETQAYKAIGVLADGTRADMTLAATWKSGTAAVASVDSLGRAKALTAGSSVITATYNGASATTTLNVSARVGTDAIDPIVAITSPSDGSSLSSPVQVIGTATDTNFQRYELSLTVVGSTQSTPIASGTSAISNGVLGTINPTNLLNGVYELRLTAYDRNNNRSTVATSVTINGDRKIGLFSLTFRDLEVPVAGIPIVVTRVYDSRDKQQGDFGIGWRLGVQSLSLRTNRVLGTGWVRNQSGATVALAPTADHKVTVVLPDGKVEEFDMKISPTSNLGSLDSTRVVGFTARPGTRGTLQALSNDSLLVVSGGAGVELTDDGTLNTYDPQVFRYTTSEGEQIDISRTAGVLKSVDRNGNSLTISAAGIIHSSGKSVKFTRDFLGRITEVTDPMGRVQRYTYDGNGDLVSYADALSNTTKFAYDNNHGLIDIRDPLGGHAVRNEFDDQGRLTASIDAAGNRVTFTHNDSAQEDVITDRRGNQSRMLYDASGNVLSLERSVTIEGKVVNAVTTYSYDADGNQTSERNADGVFSTATFNGSDPLVTLVDPNGLALKKTFIYNSANDVSAVIDAGGRSFNFSYDGAGKLSAVTLPDSGTTTTEANSRGEVMKSRDSAGVVTSYTRDASGNVTREEIADSSGILLRRADFTYDANGNKTSDTLYRSVDGASTPMKVTYAYDGGNRLISVTDPAGGISKTEYDAADRVTATVDPLGRRTTYTYDSLGLLSRITQPDQSFEAYTYDLNGNKLTETDAAGRVTRFAYDELDRLVKTTYADGNSVQTVYSPGGKVAATIDARGNRVDYIYDSAGRNTSTLLPAVPNGVAGALTRPRVDRTLTALGQFNSVTDPSGHATAYRFDANGRLVQITFADGGVRRMSYDSLGRRTEVTNEEGQTTRYSYDGLGRLVTVNGAAGSATYTYDEAGNLLTQTDALGRVSQYRYDNLNRLTERRYPDGKREVLGYDAVGNLISRTDGKGRSTTLEYNSMDRLSRKTLPGGSTVSYTYTADGNRATVVDGRGTTSYTYDSMGLLSQVTQPGGQTIDYTHDVNGNLSGLASGAGSFSYSYDAMNRMVSMAAPEGATRYYYDLSGRRVRATAPNGVSSDYAYDDRGRTTRLTQSTSQGTVLDSFTNVYSPAGRLVQSTQQDGSTERFGYDEMGRLTSEVRAGSTPLSISHIYDAVGNRTQTTRNGFTTTYTYNSNDQLLSDGSTGYTYDENGNVATRTMAGVTTQYGYDVEDRLISVTGDGTNAQYAYDADGNRVQSTTSAGVTKYLVDNGNSTGLSQVLEERDGAGGLKARYSYGTELTSMTRNGVVSHYLRDSHRNVRALANTGGSITDEYSYDGYGNTIATNGATDNPYRYSGERLDSESGLYQMRARYYNPGMGRFMSRDPLPGSPDSPMSTHRYSYANLDPIDYSDPTGMTTYGELSVGQFINAMLDTHQFTNKLAAACKMESGVQAIDTLTFLAEFTAQTAQAGLALSVLAAEFVPAEEHGKWSYKWGGKTELSILEIERKNARYGTLEKLGMSLASSAGKIGVKASFKTKGAVQSEIEVAGPPLTVKGALSGKHKIPIMSFGSCGITGGELTAESSIKAYQGFRDKHEKLSYGGGVSGAVDLKASMFGNYIKVAIPLFGADFDGVSRKMSFSLFGVTGTPAF